MGNPTITSGYLIHGLKLDGVGDYVSLPNVGNFGSRIGPYTFEVWLKTSHKRRWSAIFKVNEAPCEIKNIGYGILINAWLGRGFENRIETKEDGILLERSPKRENGCGGSASGRTYPISDGEWHHIVWTIRKATQEERGDFRDLPDEADCLKSFLYLDMEPIMSPTSCSSPNANLPYTKPIFLGAVNNMGKASGFFQGVFDEVRIYDRALTEEEVIHNYESGIGLSVEPIQKLSTVWGALKTKH